MHIGLNGFEGRSRPTEYEQSYHGLKRAGERTGTDGSVLTVRPDASADGVCPNCRASLSASDAVVRFESDADSVTLVECLACGAVVAPASSDVTDGDAWVSRGRSVRAPCATCGAPVTFLVPEHSVVTDRRPDGVVSARCDRCAGVTAVGFRRETETN